MTTTESQPVTEPRPFVGEDDWSLREALAEALIPLVGRLFREHGVITAIYGRSLVNKSARKILKLHRFARHIDGTVLPIAQTLAIVESLDRLPLSPATIDIGELHRLHQEPPATSWEDFLREQLASILDTVDQPGTTDVVLYGFGRIGRLLARLMIENHGAPNGLRLRAIVVRPGGPDDLVKRASLLRRDTVHGAFDGSITVDPDRNTITANGTVIDVINADDPATIDYTAYGIQHAVLADNTGRWRDADGLARHLACPGIDKVWTSPTFVKACTMRSSHAREAQEVRRGVPRGRGAAGA
jgi:glyceraldehyde 3-phosphate dehydrogenase